MGTVKLCDFGICKIRVPGAISQNNLMYTEGYLAPEVISADGFSHESDLYAFGVTLWEIIHRRSSRYFNREDLKDDGAASDDFSHQSYLYAFWEFIQKRVSSYFNRDHLKEDGPALHRLVYECTDVVERRITLENALRLVDDEKQKVIGKARVDFGELFDRQPVISSTPVPPSGNIHPGSNEDTSPQDMETSTSSINPQLPEGFVTSSQSSASDGQTVTRPLVGKFMTGDELFPELQEGDLIEFLDHPVWGREHWGVYVGKQLGIHMFVHNQQTEQGWRLLATSFGMIELRRLPGQIQCRINNSLDEYNTPRRPHEIVKEAVRMIGSRYPWNAKDFAMHCRYGK